MQCIHWGNETCITAILMIIVYHSCIRDQCWKSFPSPFFLPQHMSPKVGVEPKALSDLANKARPRRVSFPPPQPHGVSLRSPRAESEASKKLWRSQPSGFVHLLVCPTKCLPSYPKIIWWNIIYIHLCIDTDLFFLAQDLYVQTLRLTSAPPVVAF